jgi:zinc transporter 1/2/3
MDTRLVSVFTIFISSLIGSFGCYVVSKNDKLQTPIYKSLINLFSAGVITSLAIVHISNEVILELNEYIEFPLGACCVLFGLLSMCIFDNMSHSWNNDNNQNTNVSDDIEAPLNDTECMNCEKHCHKEHEHNCIANLNTKTLANVVVDTNKSNKHITVYMFEFACVFHSFIIGLSLGLTDNDKSAKTLMIALCFHQFLEGISLGIMVSESSMKILKSIIITFGYSITTPIAIITGYLLDKHYNVSTNNEKLKVVVTSCFQGFAGGMLLYIGLFQLIAEEFSKETIQKSTYMYKKTIMYISLLLGASSMCIMGMWI